MTLSTVRSNVTRIQSSIADLRKKDVAEIKKEAILAGKIGKANDAIGKAKSASTMSRVRTY